MQRWMLALVLLTGACGPKAPDAPAAPVLGKRVIHSMQLNEGQPSHISFESEHAQGSIEIAGDVHIGYQSITHTPDSAGLSRQVITIEGKTLDFWGTELELGTQSYGKLAGPVRIKIGREGVSVNDEKRGEL